MQQCFDYHLGEIEGWRSRLTPIFGGLSSVPRRRPLGQMVKSLISSRTKDAVSLRAYWRLGRRWPEAGRLAGSAPSAIEAVIFDVTFADRKALQLPQALQAIGRERPDYALEFLGKLPVEDALAWLERLSGVGRKVAAATLNASTLRRPVFIVDSHVHRILARIGFIGAGCTAKAASEIVTASGQSLGADGLLELFAQMKRLGQTVCRFEQPHCALCPLARCCRHAAEIPSQA